MSMCLERSLIRGFMEMSIAPVLSVTRISGISSGRSSASAWFSQICYLVAMNRAIYSASVVDVAIERCLLDLQHIVPLPYLFIYLFIYISYCMQPLGYGRNT